MVSDNRESSLISSIKSTLNNISHSFIINSLRRQGNNQRGVLGWGGGGRGWGFMFIMFTCSSACVGRVIINKGCWGGGLEWRGGAKVVGGWGGGG